MQSTYILILSSMMILEFAVEEMEAIVKAEKNGVKRYTKAIHEYYLQHANKMLER